MALIALTTNSILGQEIDMAFMAPSGALAAYRAGNLKILGITAAEPSPLAPEVPTIAGNAGLPETFRAELWIAAVGSSDAQPDVIARLNAEIVKILGSDEV
ncbi:tripartite tricarboxylate transporter substrate-binding protein [Aquibium sp. ELW1220]|uniref:tripartite tricarboxylate transporter substrate-binding protein n=1 Tax=Aquibium sp. ELW1220 TaxID=2976766 RepID=UPI0025AF2D8E|nr:tripartite tricarboxylate transporter substrate-binding protein [Aquibium sp. ELW1220]MDN2582458.1 tripartite tricarboxylate transporter substrate-binding protein [Aquibium sp. ELW1220]